MPSGVTIDLKDGVIGVKGPKGALTHKLHPHVSAELEGGEIKFAPASDVRGSIALTGTSRALVANMVQGVNKGFEKKLELVGVGYRAQAQGKKLNLSLGFSHPVVFMVPEGVTIETPAQNQVVITGADKQLVGQVAANIRAFRPPEPYKGKGVKYSDERIIRKDAKKK